MRNNYKHIYSYFARVQDILNYLSTLVLVKNMARVLAIKISKKIYQFTTDKTCGIHLNHNYLT